MLELAIASQIFVTHTMSDLVIPLKSRNHEQLLVLLGRLRKRIKLARMEPRRHKEVSRTLGRALGKRRRLDLDKSVAIEILADVRRHPMAKHDIFLEALATKIKIAIFEPDFFVDIVAVSIQRHRRRLGTREYFERLRLKLNLACGNIGINHLLGARGDCAGDPNHPLPTQLRREIIDLGAWSFGVFRWSKDDLNDS